MNPNEESIQKKERGAPAEALDNEDTPLPAALERAVHYTESVAALQARFPNAAIPHGELELETYMREHIWAKQECVDALPWSNRYLERFLFPELQCLIMNEFAAKTFPLLFAKLSRIAQNAQTLYAPLDIAQWLQSNLSGHIETVLVPLSMFTKDPRRFREAFVRERDERRRLGQIPGNKWLHEWNCCKDFLEESSNEVVGQWFNDLSTKSREQGKATNRVELEQFEVHLPEKIIPRFFTLEQVGEMREYGTRDAGITTIRSFAFAKWKRKGEKTRKNLYTKGLAVGGKNYHADYALGLVDLMTVERFLNTYGRSGFDEASWLIGKDEIVWSEDPYKEVPNLPMMELASFLAVRHDKQGRVARF